MGYQWEFRQLWQYFDYSKKAVYRNSEEIAKLPEKTRTELYRQIADSVTRYVAGFSGTPEDFCRLIGTVVNDLYRTMLTSARYTENQAVYLSYTAKPMMDALSKRGISVHYGANSVFEPARSKSEMMQFRKYWNDCGFFFFETVTSPDPKMALKHIAAKVKELEKPSYVMLIPGGNKTDFRMMYESIGRQGVMTFFRDQSAEGQRFKIYPFRMAEKKPV
ncbi:MAG: hypothetical protein IJG94_00355 [Clostridia bacterium]|nr:hypothetical protein [Clostridia bacterium]